MDQPVTIPDGVDLTATPRGYEFEARVLSPQQLAYDELIVQLREFNDVLSGVNPPVELAAELTAQLASVTAELRPYAVDEWTQIFGRLRELPGRGQTTSPVFILDDVTHSTVRGRVTFGRYFLGGNGAVHGGALPLLFDEVLGRLANNAGRPAARTAYLHVDYRSITPIERELQVLAWFDSEEGRKRVLRATLHDGETLCAEAEGLFVALLPGQP